MNDKEKKKIEELQELCPKVDPYLELLNIPKTPLVTIENPCVWIVDHRNLIRY